MPRHHRKIIDAASATVLFSLAILNIATWKNILTAGTKNDTARVYFLPVTQGESALLVLQNKISMLTDAGSDAAATDGLQKIALPEGQTYIDVAIISYPQAADYEGYQYLLQHYRIGAFIYNGRNDTAHNAVWQQLVSAIGAKGIPLITVGAGDRLRYGDDEIDILSPDATFVHSPEPSDTGIVQRVITPDVKMLFAADVGSNVEEVLLARNSGARGDPRAGLSADILKAPFPGIGTTAGDVFLRAVAPHTIVIAPGVKGTASAPTKATLSRLATSSGAAIVTTGHDTLLLYNE